MDTKIWFSIWRVVLAIGIGIVFILIIHFVLKKLGNHLKNSGMSEERVKRLTTLIHAGNSIGYVLVILVCTLMVLHELGINITPILASAGVVGLAFSLGAQTVIKDYLAGIVILSENLYTVGDTITIGTVTGTVEHISIRATYLRDVEGKLNVIPNGDIRSVANLTTKWAQIILTLNFDYETDMENVVKILEETVQAFQSEKEIKNSIKGIPMVLGWTGFTDWAVQAQIISKTDPGKQWLVARLMRKHILQALKENGVHLAIPRERIEKIS